MDSLSTSYPITPVYTSGSGVIGITGKPVYLQGILNAQSSAQTLSLFSGTAAVTLVFCTLAGKAFTQIPMAVAGGITYQTANNPGDADLRLIFFWIPGSTT